MKNENVKTNIENYKFEPIKGYPLLNWRGKRPFSMTSYFPAQIKESYGTANESGWFNKIYWGDNLQVMSHLLKENRGSVDLIYLDPPFDSRVNYSKKIRVKGEAVSGNQSAFEEKQYGDIWNNDEYLQFMYERLILARELISDQGVIALHCDSKQGHRLQCLLDEIFGTDNFVNEVTWHYYNKMAPDSKCFPRASDKIFIYCKNQADYIFHKQVEKRDEPVKQLVRKFVGGKAINARDEDGNVMYRMTDEKRVDDVWRISMLQPADKTENVFYPTQKPEALISRILSAFTNEGSIVFDPFMGSGTLQMCALKSNRRFLGADINLGAIQTTMKRLVGYLKAKSNSSGIQMFVVNNYELFKNPVEAKELLMETMEINKISNSIYDGELNGRMVKIMPVNRIATRADLNELINGFDYRTFKKRKEATPNKPVEKLLLVCMGHEIDLKANLELAVKEAGFDIDVEVVDILRDKTELQFKRDAEAKVVTKKGKLIVEKFYPMNLLQKLSLQKSKVDDWRELVESVMIDWNYDGAVLSPSVIDIAEREGLVSGQYEIPKDSGTIRVKITDLLSESLEIEVSNG